MNYSTFRDMVGGVAGEVFEEFIISGATHRSPKNGRMFRVSFRRVGLRLGKSAGRSFWCSLFMRGDKLAVCHIDDFAIVDRNLEMMWFDLGDPDLVDEVRDRLGHYLNYG
jgi:hypothetical protein